MQPICLFLQQYHQPLAVPSDGSNLMQRLIATIDKLQRKRLQYPQTGRTSGNLAAYPDSQVFHDLQYPQTGRTSGNLELVEEMSRTRNLAVPSDGSNLMQRPISGNLQLIVGALQYPQTGRTSCNLAIPHGYQLLPHLAVPSDGSNLMQPPAQW